MAEAVVSHNVFDHVIILVVARFAVFDVFHLAGTEFVEKFRIINLIVVADHVGARFEQHVDVFFFARRRDGQAQEVIRERFLDGFQELRVHLGAAVGGRGAKGTNTKMVGMTPSAVRCAMPSTVLCAGSKPASKFALAWPRP